METVMTRKEWERCYARETKVRMQRRVKRGMKLAMSILVIMFIIGISSYWNVQAETPKETVTTKGEVELYQGNTYIYTNDGYIWSVENSTELNQGDKVKVTFDTNGTFERKDDVIISIKHRLF